MLKVSIVKQGRRAGVQGWEALTGLWLEQQLSSWYVDGYILAG
jgi:hypothetical protein